MVRFAAALTVFFAAAVASAQGAAPAAPPPPQFRWTEGPTKVKLGHDLTMDLPGDSLFLGMPQAADLMKRMGSFYSDNLLGVVVSKDEKQQWIVVIRFDAEGYIKDDEKIDAGDLLKSIKEGTEEANKERTQQGFKPLRIDGWSEPPVYQKDVHHLVWALLVSDDDGTSVNYNTRVLGRRGYVSLNLVTDPKKLDVDRPVAARLLAATQFDQGARYEDFDKKTDKVAEYGLAGLILGGVGVAGLAKIGFFAKAGKLLVVLFAKGFKLIAVAIVGLFAGIKRLFGGAKDPAPMPGDPPAGGSSSGSDPTSGGGAAGPPPTGGGDGAAGGGSDFK